MTKQTPRGRRYRRRQAGGGWIYLAGGALAVIAVLAVIIIGAATRDGGSDGDKATVVPTPRPATVPRDGLTYGNADAPVTITEYMDFQCPICKMAAVSVLPPIEEEYVESGKVKLVARPIAILGDESVWAAGASFCANDQGRFWEYYDILFANQGAERSGAFSTDRLKALASALDLDSAAFGACLDSGTYFSRVREDTSAARQSGVQGTPTFLVNGEKVQNNADAIKAAIDAALAGGA